MSMSFGGGPGLPPRPTPPAAGQEPDAWGMPRPNESVEAWYAREVTLANAKLKGTPAEGRGVPSVQAALAYDRRTWDARLKAGRDAFAAERAERDAAAAADRQARLAAARQLRAAHDQRQAEDQLLAWADQQRHKVPGRV